MRRERIADLGGLDSDLPDSAATVLRAVSGEPATSYAKEKLLRPIAQALQVDCVDPAMAIEFLDAPKNAFLFALSRYACGKVDENGRYELVSEALRRTLDDSDFVEYLASDDVEALWLSYIEVCEKFGFKPRSERQFTFEGLCELNMESYRQKGEPNLFHWLRNEVKETGRVNHVFDRLTEIRALGPKNASHILRDSAFLFGFEDTVHYADRLFLQPVTPALRQIAGRVLQNGEQRPADWIIAGKISKAARICGVSGVRFNMGTAYLGSRPDKDALQALRELLSLESEADPI